MHIMAKKKEFEDSAEFTDQLYDVHSHLNDKRMLRWMEDTEHNYLTSAKGLVDKYKNIVKQYNEVVKLLEELDE